MYEWFWRLLSGAITLCQLAVAAGVLAALLGRWRIALGIGHVVTVLCGLTAVLGVAALVALGAVARLGLFGDFIASTFPGPDAGQKARHLAELISCIMNAAAGASLAALFSATLWMVAHRRLKKMA